MPNYEHNIKHQTFEGTFKGTFKQRHGNRKKSFNHEKHRKIQSFQRNTGDLRTPSKTSSSILHFQKMPSNKKNRYLLFMFERKTIIEHQGSNLLNQRNELIS